MSNPKPQRRAKNVNVTLYPKHLEILERHARTLIIERPFVGRSAVLQDILDRFARQQYEQQPSSDNALERVA